MKRSLLFVGMCLVLQGCMLSWIGQPIATERLSTFRADVTTPADVEAALGPPDNVTHKPAEQLVVFTYQHIVSLGVGMPLLAISATRARQRGSVLNVMFKNGLFKGYELVEMKQKLFSR